MNKFSIITCLAILGLTQSSLATTLEAQAKLDFAAPIVQNTTTMPGDTPFGSIVFDNANGKFMGLSANGVWQQLGITGSFANRTLSNLTTTALNIDLLPGANNSISLGNNAGAQYLGIASSCGTFNNSTVKIGSCAPGSAIGSNYYYSATGASYLNLSSSAAELVSSTNVTIQPSTTNGVINLNGHISVANSGNASVVCLGNAGSTGLCNNIGNLTDAAGIINLIPSGSGVAAGVQLLLNFGRTYASPFPVCVVTPANDNAAGIQFYARAGSGNEFGLTFLTAPTPGTQYLFHYQCVSVN